MPGENSIFEEVGGAVDDDAAYQAAMEADGGTPTPEDKGAAAQETQPQNKTTQAQEETPKGYVPHEALHEERQMRKELQEELKLQRQEFMQLQGRVGQFESLREELARMRSERTREEQEQEYDNDPVGYVKKEVDGVKQTIQQQREEQQRLKEQQDEWNKQQEAVRQFQQTLSSQINDYIKTQPDYPDAFKFLMEARQKELEAIGITSQQDIARALDAEAFSLAQVAMQRNVNPGEAAYKLAQARGYKPKEGNPAMDEGDDKTEETLAEQMARLERGQQAAQSLSGGGNPPKGDVTLADIDKMSEEEFNRFFSGLANDAGAGDFMDG